MRHYFSNLHKFTQILTEKPQKLPYFKKILHINFVWCPQCFLAVLAWLALEKIYSDAKRQVSTLRFLSFDYTCKSPEKTAVSHLWPKDKPHEWETCHLAIGMWTLICMEMGFQFIVCGGVVEVNGWCAQLWPLKPCHANFGLLLWGYPIYWVRY